MDRRQRIAIVGAGLGGLAVAGFLQRAGFAATVYEQAPTFSRIGAGIILSANVTKALRRLGIEQDLVARGLKPHCYISRAWDMAAFDEMAKDWPARRGGDPAEIVGAALYLCGPAASYTTGALLAVDGGRLVAP